MTSHSRNRDPLRDPLILLSLVALFVVIVAAPFILSKAQEAGEPPPFTYDCDDHPYTYREAHCDG